MMRKMISLMYHDVYEYTVQESGFQTAAANKYKISKEEFAKQIQRIAQYCKDRNILKEDVMLTFDDGGVSFYAIIAPILKEYGFKGYFFISTAFINTKGFLTADQVISLHEEGHFIGAHSHTHPGMLNKLPLVALEEEWSVSISLLNELLKTKTTHVSIPGGSFSKEMGNILANMGIESIFISQPTNKTAFISDNCRTIGRFTIYKNTKVSEVEDLLKTISLTRLRQIVKWKSLMLFKYVLGTNYLRIRKFLLKS